MIIQATQQLSLIPLLNSAIEVSMKESRKTYLAQILQMVSTLYSI
jgi:hypothetical protein